MSLRIAMIGTGSMGGALLSGMLAAADSSSADAADMRGVPPANARATTKSQASAEALAQRTGVATMALDSDPAANRTQWPGRTSSSWASSPG
jgi:pyrroline-5-carboxylate reductase